MSDRPRCRIADGLAWVVEDVAEDPVVYVAPLPDGRPVVLVGPAARVWSAVAAARSADGWATRADVIALLVEAYAVDAAVIGPDVEGFLADLVSARLVVTDPAPG